MNTRFITAVHAFVKTRHTLFLLSLVGCLALVLMGLGPRFGARDARDTNRILRDPLEPAAPDTANVARPVPSTKPEAPRLGRIRSRFELAEAETPVTALAERQGAKGASASDLEAFFARHIDPLFHRTGGWQIYNPDRLDRGQESARTPSLAFAAGLRYRHSF